MDTFGGLTPSTRVTTAGSGINGAVLASNGGQQSSLLVEANMPPADSVTPQYVTGAGFPAGSSYAVNATETSGGALQSVQVNDTNPYPLASSTAFTNMQPSLINNVIIRVS
jgi:microcystin-dependent protein